MRRTLRTATGVVIIGLLLAGAQLTTRDCAAGQFRTDNCLWMAASQSLGFPQRNKLLRAVFLEVVGLTMLAGLYLTYRRVLTPALNPCAGRAPNGQDTAAKPLQSQGASEAPSADLRQKDDA